MPETFGQHHVEQHEVGVDGVEHVEGLRRRRWATWTWKPSRRRPIVSASTKDSSSSTTRMVLLGGSCSTCLRHRDGDAALARPGCVIVNVEPWPSADVTDTVPPWLVATWRTMARPRPVPPVSRLRARSTR